MHADHFIWSAYGTWIPSCPRESWPRYMRSWERTRPGLDASNVDPDRDPYRVNRLAAEKTRHFPPVRFNSLQMQAIAEGFARCVRSRQSWVWACCIMPEYVQILITTPRTPPTQMMGLMRCEATKRLHELNLHPMSEHGQGDGSTPLMWSHTKWHQQLKNDDTIREAIAYINELPEREGSARQNWDFVRPFESLDRCREESEEYEREAVV